MEKKNATEQTSRAKKDVASLKHIFTSRCEWQNFCERLCLNLFPDVIISTVVSKVSPRTFKWIILLANTRFTLHKNDWWYCLVVHSNKKTRRHYISINITEITKFACLIDFRNKFLSIFFSAFLKVVYTFQGVFNVRVDSRMNILKWFYLWSSNIHSLSNPPRKIIIIQSTNCVPI